MINPKHLRSLVGVKTSTNPGDEDRVLAGRVAAELAESRKFDQLIADYDPERDGNPPAWVADEATWERAKEAVDPEGEGADYDEPWAVTSYVYRKLGGALK